MCTHMMRYVEVCELLARAQETYYIMKQLAIFCDKRNECLLEFWNIFKIFWGENPQTPFCVRHCVDNEGVRFRSITRWPRHCCVFVSLGPWITASDLKQSRRRWTVLLRSILPSPGSQIFILVFDVPSPKCFAQPGDHHSCQAVTPALF